VAALEMREFGARYMGKVVSNARSLATALHGHGLAVVGARRGFTETHQVLVDVRRYGGGQAVSQQLERANIMANKMLLPGEEEEPGGIRIGTVEVTRLGMGEAEMASIAGLIQRVLVRHEDPETLAGEVRALRAPFQELHYCLS
jgi:glycine hydroxymethyltransferase